MCCMFNNIKIDVIRNHCKNTIENLEIWLRNLIDNELTDNYGKDYFSYLHVNNGARLIKNEIVKEAKERISKDSNRYPRLIDALLLDDEIKIICNPELFKKHFSKALSLVYPLGNDEARFFLNQLIPIRNKLYHSNSVSIREAEKVICYSNDILDSLKDYYMKKSLEKKYNAPTITKVSDSFGNIFFSTQINRNGTGRGLCDTRISEKSNIYSGDIISIEVEIDPSFNSTNYEINWVFDKKEETIHIEELNKITIHIENKHIRTDFGIYCLVTSKESWHRCGDVDDSVCIIYEITPNK